MALDYGVYRFDCMKLSPWAWMAALTAITFLILSVALSVIFGWPTLPDLGSTAAAWVQAVGAIASIWAAWSIARQQSKRVQADAKRADLAKCAAIAGLLRHALRVANHEPFGNEGTVRSEQLLHGIRDSISALDRVDVLLLPDPDLANAVFESKYALERLANRINAQDRNVLMLLHYKLGVSRSCISTLEAQIKSCDVVSARMKR